MRRTGGGSIVNIASVQRVISEPNSGANAASKGGSLLRIERSDRQV